VVTHPRADELIARLAHRGVAARGYYRRPLHQQVAMAPYVRAGAPLETTEELARTNLALPIGPLLGAAQAREVVDAVAIASRN
jgi:dTDP-4-amino-4,6-dideoxygalactose transaminase